MPSDELIRTYIQARDLWQSFALLGADSVPISLQSDAFYRIIKQIPGIGNAERYREIISSSIRKTHDTDGPPIDWHIADLLLNDTTSLYCAIRKLDGRSKTYSGCMDISFFRSDSKNESYRLGILISVKGGLVAFDFTHYDSDGLIQGYLLWHGADKPSQKKGEISVKWDRLDSQISNIDLLAILTESITQANIPFDFNNVCTVAAAGSSHDI